MLNHNILITFLLFLIANTVIWFQLNGQLVWDWFKNNPFLLSLLGIPISYLLLLATKYGYIGFGNLWAVRFTAFAFSMITFSFFTWCFLGETVTIKNAVSLVLALALIIIQFI